MSDEENTDFSVITSFREILACSDQNQRRSDDLFAGSSGSSTSPEPSNADSNNPAKKRRSDDLFAGSSGSSTSPEPSNADSNNPAKKPPKHMMMMVYHIPWSILFFWVVRNILTKESSTYLPTDVLHLELMPGLLDHRLNQVEDLRIMEAEPEEFWVQLLKRYLVDAPNVTVRGVPSMEEQQAMALGEKKRIEAQRDTLGAEGLKQKAARLRQATTEN